MKKKLALTALLFLLLDLLNGTVQAGTLAPQAQSDPHIVPAGETNGSGRIAPEIQRAIGALQAGEMISVIVTLSEQTNLSGLAIPADLDRAARHRQVIGALQSRADVSQKSLKALLETRRAEGRVAQVTYFWIFNGLAVTATPDVIQELAARPEVLKITPNETIQAPAPPAGQGLITLSANEPNLDVINAPGLWDLGFRGQGIVVANVDTGVDVNHPDLATKWRGGTNSWFDPNGEHPTTPIDRNGHGTQTMGVMVGGEVGGTAIGVAPDAQWIAVKIFDDQGQATLAGIHQGYQWLLDPDGNPNTPDAPHVINSSWTFQAPGCNLEFQADLQALRTAGIVPIFAAGNAGPGASTSVSPSNNPEALAVGATDNSDLIYLDSSRGPSACGEAETVFPEVVAPGVNVRTTDLFGLYTSASGTSLAAPHAAGVLALLLSAYPNLTVAEQEAALINPAVDLGPAGPDNDYGYGRLDALAAYLDLKSDVNTTVTQATGGSLVYTDTQNSPTTVLIPAGAVTDTTTLYFTAMTTATAAPPSGFAFAGHTFTLDAYQDGNLWSDFVFSKPISIVLYYTDTDVAGVDESSLTLDYWNEDQNQWLDATTTCTPASTYERHPDENWLAVPVCHLSEFALLGEKTTQSVYLPLIIRGSY